MKHSEVPFSMRKFTLDGNACDIEDFISCNSTTFEAAALLRQELEVLEVDYHMYFALMALPLSVKYIERTNPIVTDDNYTPCVSKLCH